MSLRQLSMFRQGVRSLTIGQLRGEDLLINSPGEGLVDKVLEIGHFVDPP